MTEPSPPARRLARPGWLDPRIALGVLLVMASVVTGARVFASAGRYSEVYVARHPLVAGEHLSSADLAVGRVRFGGQGARYLAAGRPPVGYLVTRFVGAGELLPASALTATPGAVSASRLVTVPVPAGHLPVELSRGDEVDVYLTEKSSSDRSATSQQVLGAAVVDAVGGSGGLSAADTTSVVLVVPREEVATLVKAVEAGSLDLVRLPDPAVAGLPMPASTMATAS